MEESPGGTVAAQPLNESECVTFVRSDRPIKYSIIVALITVLCLVVSSPSAAAAVFVLMA